MEIVSHFSHLKPLILTRGYKRSGKTAELVNARSDIGWKVYGDEPWMYAQRTSAPIVVAANRRDARPMIDASRPGVVVMDDGFQHVALKRDVDLVAINVDKDPATSHCLPYGELREPLSALRSAAVLVFTGTKDSKYLKSWTEVVGSFLEEDRVFFAQRKTQGFYEGATSTELLRDDLVFAVCGIAEPERFFQDVQRQTSMVGKLAYPDHWDYSDADLKRLHAAFRESRANVMVTTEKDYFKLVSKMTGVRVVSLRVSYEIPPTLWSFLEARMGAA